MRPFREIATVMSLALTAAGAATAQVEARVVPPDEPPPGPPRTFWRDTLVQHVGLHGGTLEVVVERDSTNPAATSGRYVVRWNGLPVAVSDDTGSADIPVVVAVATGTPTVVVLNARADLKVIVLEAAPRALGGLAARAFSVAGVMKRGDLLRVVAAPENGAFTLATAGVTLRYADRTLRLEPSSTVAGAGAAVRQPAESVYVAAMKADLRNLVTAQEAFFADHAKYADRVQLLDMRLARGNRLIRLRPTENGWTALMGNENTRTVCAVFVGSTAVAPATREGEPACV